MSSRNFFSYGSEEIDYLKSKDPLLADAIDTIGIIERPVNPDLFEALIETILGQQISTKAAATVRGRFFTCFEPVTPENLVTLRAEDLQKCGITFRKAEYIWEIARRVSEGELNLESLHSLSDEEVIVRLRELPGIGVWSAEMLMLFSMQRPNILSYGDLAILRGLRMLYRHRKITPELFAKYRRRYAPHASVASLYLWAVAGGAIPHLKDLAARKPK